MEAGDCSLYPTDDSSFPSRRKSAGNKRRFSDDQIRSLESIFEEETKLEPRKKLQLAMDLGLQPRQVSIWFQNRRARWKSKQIEKEYSVLKADYDALAAGFDALQKEKLQLLKQLQKLGELLEKSGQPEEAKIAGEMRPVVCSDGESQRSVERLGAELDLIAMRDGSLTWPEEWREFDSGSFSDQSSTTMEWWNFWG